MSVFGILFIFLCHIHYGLPVTSTAVGQNQFYKNRIYDDQNTFAEWNNRFAATNILSLGSQISDLRHQFDVFFRKEAYDEALATANKLAELSLKIDDKKHAAEAHYACAVILSKEGQLSSATENVLKAIRIVDGLGLDSLDVKYNNFLSGVFIELREPKKTLYYARKAFDIAEKSGKSNLLIKAKMQLILGEVLSGDHVQAKAHLEEMEKITDKSREPFQFAKIYLFLSHLYFEKKQYKPSLAQLHKIPPLYQYIDGRHGIRLHTEMAMAENYTELQNFKMAKYYFEQNIDQALKELGMGDIKICFQIGSKIYEGIGSHVKSLYYLKQYTAFNDSLHNASIEKAIHDSEIKYQTTLKEKTLSDQKLQLINKDYELQKKNRYLIIGTLTLVLIILLSLITYLIYRNRSQAIKLNLLKAQIHPHFLFNTLNNLYALSLSKSDEAPGVVIGLSSILRYILYECNTKEADLQKELDIISEYINLERVRYTDALEVNTYFDSDFTRYKIAPLLLLPLVENAYKHGVSKLEKASWINIEAKIKDSRFLFKIANNKPLIKDDLEQGTMYGNIGLKNIRERLSILYPKRHKLKIMESDDIFVVSLELTLR